MNKIYQEAADFCLGNDETPCHKNEIAKALTLLCNGEVLVKYDPDCFLSFDGGKTDAGDTRGHLWHLDLKLDPGDWNDPETCFNDNMADDMRPLLLDVLEAIAARMTRLAGVVRASIDADYPETKQAVVSKPARRKRGKVGAA